jgi:eukaryotic-like serine/threonine-protein kinase
MSGVADGERDGTVEREGTLEREGTAACGPASGDVVAGVRLASRVGAGGSGQVWSGDDLRSGERVAVKLLDDGSADVEGWLLAGLRHPHVLAVRRACARPAAIVTDLAQGGSLHAQVRARGSLRPSEVVTVVAPLADALGFLHARGVVHGDVTATNVLFVERGRPVLGDIGSASLAGSGETSATPGYAAPEVRAGAAASQASDVHGLAAVAWFALTGTVPAEEAADRLPLRLLAPECPDELVEAVLAGLDPDPAARPDPADLAAAVRAAAPAEPVRLVPSAALGIRADEAVTYRVRAAAHREAPDDRGRRSRLRRPWRTGRARRVVTGRGVRPTPGPGHGRAVLGVLLLAAALTAAVATLPPLDDLVAARSSPAVGPAASGAVTAGPHVPPGAVPAPDTAPDTAPVTAPDVAIDLAAEVQRIVGDRQRALRSGDAQALLSVHHPEGTTLDADRELVAAGPVPVAYELLAVRPVDGEPGVVEVSLRTTSRTGSGQHPGPDHARTVLEEVRLTLDRHDGRWLLREVG